MKAEICNHHRGPSLNRSLLFVSTCLFSCVISGGAFAQTSGSPGVGQKAPEASNTLQEVVVTGSRLQGVVPVGATVSTVNRQTIEQSGATTIADMVSLVPSLSGLGWSEGSKAAQGGNNNISDITLANLRGLGPAATLTLLDGHRLPHSGSSGIGVDLNSVPDVAVERVEVLADGASAVYGSDAVAGVVNLILRRNLDGAELTARGGFANGYSDWKAGALFGHRWSAGGFTVAIEQNDHTRLAGTSRSYDRQNLTSQGGSNGSQTGCFPGNVTVAGQTYPVLASGAIGAAGAPNTCEPYARNDLLPSVRRTSGALTADYDITSQLKFSADGVFSFNKFQNYYAFSPSSINVPQTNAFFQLPPGVALATLPNCAGSTITKCLPMSYYVGGVLGGNRAYEGTELNYTFHPSLEYDFAPGWNLRADLTAGHNEEHTNGFNFNSGALTAALASSDPTTAFDPFGTRTNQAVLNNIANYVIQSRPSYTLYDYGMTLNGDLFKLPGGDVKADVHAEYREEDFRGQSVTGPVGAVFLITPYNRHVESVSGEVNIPFFSALNAVPGIQDLVLNVAAGYDNYSDFGSTANPKVGLNWAPVHGLTFKGSYSTSFRAPGPDQLVGVVGKSSVYLPALGPSGSVSTLQINSGNPSLKPENSTNYSFGVEFAPDPVPGLKVTATYFNIDYKNVIQAQFNNPSVLSNPSYASLVTLNPTAAQIAAVLAAYPVVNGPSGTTAAIVDGRPNNLGEIQVNGVDFQLDYVRRTERYGRFGFSASGTVLSKYSVAATPTAALVSELNQYTYPVNFKGRGGFTWADDGGLNTALFVNYVNSYKFGTATVGSWTTVDLYAGYMIRKMSWASNTKLSINVTNLLDTKPPFANIPAYLYNPGGFDPQQSSALGRLVALTATKKF